MGTTTLTTALIKIRGRIDAVYYAGARFSAGRLITLAGNEISFAGKLYAREQDQVVLEGRWVTHPKYGRQLEVETLTYNLELDADGLAHYLAHHPDIKGIGPVKAKRIAERFSKDFDRVIVEEPEAVAEAAKLPLATVERLREAWQKTREVNRAFTQLSAYGLTHHQVTSLVDRLGNDALGLLQDDPYLIVREIPGFGFKRVDKIARRMGTAKDDPSRIRAGILDCVTSALGQGDCWIEFEELIERANALLVMDTLDSRDRIEQWLKSLIDDGTLSCASHSSRFLVARPDIRRMEEDLAATLGQGDRDNPHFPEPEDLPDLIDELAPTLLPGQHEAVLRALSHAITLISGGAGSGKSYTVAALTRIYDEQGLRVILAAPTGKAAQRLEELSGRRAGTLHRLLGFDGKSFARGPEDPIMADVVIVDEVSMVDVPLAWQLFRTLDLDRTAVVLVGDHNQLPPVGPGSLLRDLVESRSVPTVVLDKVVRQAGVLKENSIAVLKGQVRKTSEREASGRRAWYLVDQFTDPDDAQRFLLKLFESVLSERLEFHLRDDIQVLTPTHKGPLGTRALNRALQRLIQAKLWGVEAPLPKPGRRPRLLVHDKVIQTRNNYALGVMNGAVGTVTDVDRDGSLLVAFDGMPVGIESDSPNRADIKLAYALTIHKAQGSEFPCTVLVVHKSHSFMHHRNLFYTGVTRAKEAVVIVGDRWGIANCAKKRHLDKRKTFLSLLLSSGGAL